MIAQTRSRWRWLVVVVAVVLVALVAFARLYSGVHYPTDLVGSALLAIPWLLAAWWVRCRGRTPRPRGSCHETP